MCFIATGRSVSETGFHDGKCGHEKCGFTLLTLRILARETAELASRFFEVFVAVESRGFQISNIVFEIRVGCGWAERLIDFLRGLVLIVECACREVCLHGRRR